MIKRLNRDFPSLKFSVNNEEQFITIPPIYKDFGELIIQDEDYELTVFLGNFTHWHVGDFEKPINENEITTEVSEFLNDLFKNKIVMWGSNETSGGFYYKNVKPNSREWLAEQHNEYAWSGPINS